MKKPIAILAACQEGCSPSEASPQSPPPRCRNHLSMATSKSPLRRRHQDTDRRPPPRASASRIRKLSPSVTTTVA